MWRSGRCGDIWKGWGMVPEGWTNYELGAAISIVPGFPFESGHFNAAGQGAPLIRIRDLLTNVPSVGYTGGIPDGYWVNNGDLLIGMDGDFNIVKWNGGRALLNQRLCSVKTSATDVLDQDFLFHFLTPWLLKINSEIGATTVKHLSTKHLSSICAPLPPLLEQRRIANVLTAVDNAIQANAALIGAPGSGVKDCLGPLQTLKRGLLHDLLTGRVRMPVITVA